MKRTVLVLTLAVVMLLAMATAAYATQGDSTYTVNPVGQNPHGGYQVNTKKCSVCHAVHHAGELGEGTGSEALLKSTRADACTYCHISPGVSSKIVYAGDTSKYDTGDLNTAHSADGGVSCKDCHQVHAAASAMTSNAALTTKILKNIDVATGTVITSQSVKPAAADSTETALAKWCSECHTYYATWTDGASHVMTTTLLSSQTGSQVAWAASVYCKSCHNSNTVASVVVTSAFPHYTDGVRFLTSSSSTLVAASPATDSAQDGVCLRCHRDGVSDGVGMDF